jgi:hypothetical protein
MRHAASPNIDAEQEILLAIRSSPTRSDGVAQAGKCSRDDGKSRQRPLGHIDMEWIVGQRFERLDWFEPGGQDRALMKVELAYRPGSRRFRHAHSRKPQGGANIWHEHHLAIRSLEAGR